MGTSSSCKLKVPIVAMAGRMLLATVAISGLIPAAHAFAINPDAAGLLRRGHAAAAIHRTEALRAGLRATALPSASSARRGLHLMMAEGKGARARARAQARSSARGGARARGGTRQRAGVHAVLVAGSAKPKLVGLIGATGGVGRLCAAALQEQVSVRCMCARAKRVHGRSCLTVRAIVPDASCIAH